MVRLRLQLPRDDNGAPLIVTSANGDGICAFGGALDLDRITNMADYQQDLRDQLRVERLLTARPPDGNTPNLLGETRHVVETDGFIAMAIEDGSLRFVRQ